MNSNKHNDKLHGRLGPGGISCSCCTPFRSVKLNRIWLNRIKRKRVKNNIRRELNNIYIESREEG